MNKSKKSYVHDLHLLFFYNQNHVLSHLLFNLPFCEPKKTHQLFFNVVSLISTKGCFHLPLKNLSHLQILLLLLFFLIKGYQGSFLIFLMNKENRVLCFSTVLTDVFFYDFDTARRWITCSQIICCPMLFSSSHLRSFRYVKNIF